MLYVMPLTAKKVASCKINNAPVVVSSRSLLYVHVITEVIHNNKHHRFMVKAEKI